MISTVCVSIVSHGHGEMVSSLIDSLLEFPEVSQIILTINIPENINIKNNSQIRVIKNDSPLGFAKNHNQAFFNSNDTNNYFCVINPDVCILSNPFPSLIKGMCDANVGLIAPTIINSHNIVEDSARYFPTFFSLFKKYFFNTSDSYKYSISEEYVCPDWVAGMFMLFRSRDFCYLNGFDERFYLYCEDVDICARVWLVNLKVILCTKISVIHDARRDSHKHIKFMKLHLISMLKFLFKYYGTFLTIKSSKIFFSKII